MTFATNPYRSASASTDGWTRTAYDLAGRVIQVATFAAGPNTQPPDYPATSGAGVTWTGSVTTAYASEVTTVTDQAGKQRRSVVDGLGRLVRVDEPDSSGNLDTGNPPQPAQPTSYSYDARGNLVQVDQGSQQRLFTYDLISRLKTAKNPEQVNTSGQMVQTTYAYDDASNLMSKSGPNSGGSVSFTYDELNRVKTKTLSSGGMWDYAYDTATVSNAKGRLVSVALHGGTDGYYFDSYDAMGRVTASRQITTAGTANSYSMGYGYNLAGYPTGQTYPSGKEYRTTYDNAGRVNGVSRYISSVLDKTYASSYSYTATGAVSAMTLGNNLIDKTTFNARLQPTQIKLGTTALPSSVVQLDYTYGVLVNGTLDTTKNNGNVQSQVITAPKTAGGNLALTQNYTYDPLNRLSIAEELIGTTSQWKQTYDCDRWGNRAVRNTSYIPSASLTPWSANSTDFSAFDQGTNRIKPSAMPGFGYDTSGNLTSDPNTPTSGIVYDAENHQTSYTKSGAGTTSYGYDGDGHRVKRTDPDNTTTIFVYNVLGQLIGEYASGTPSGNGTSYLTPDHLGSTRVVTSAADGSGNVTVKARYDYLPFGEEIGSDHGNRTSVTGYGSSDKTRQKFTRKERDSESGLDYFLARYYSSAQGRFTSPDPDNTQGRENPSDPQSWNGYSYVGNNPLVRTDPDGRDWWQKLRNWWKHDRAVNDDQLKREVEQKRQWLKDNVFEINGKKVDSESLDKLSTNQVNRLYDYVQAGIEEGTAKFVDPPMGPVPSEGGIKNAGPSGQVSTEKYLEKNWDKATFGSVKKSIEFHVGKHGSGMSAVEYTQRALKAFSDTGAVRQATTDRLGRAAVQVVSKEGTGLYTQTGKII